MTFFVIVRHQKGWPMPLQEYDDDRGDATVMLFDSKEEAEATAAKNMMGAAYGWETYEWP